MNHNNAKKWRGANLKGLVNHVTNGGEVETYLDAWGNKMVKTVGCDYPTNAPHHLFEMIKNNDWKIPTEIVSTRTI